MARKSVKTERREQILEGLFAAMARDGTRGASITEVAEAAGIARGALHYYFESKDEIREALMSRLGDGYIKALENAMDKTKAQPEAGPNAALRALIRYHFRGDARKNEELLGVWIDFWGQAASDARVNAVVLRVQEQARALCWSALCSARPELTHLPEEQARSAGATILALVEGALLQWRVAARSERPLEREELCRGVMCAAQAYLSSLSGEAPQPPDTYSPFVSENLGAQ